MIDYNQADILESELLDTFGTEVFQRLLRDHSTYAERKAQGAKEDDCHIIWGTSDYADRGEGFGEKDQITIEKVTGDNSHIIMPRSVKSREQQRARTQERAEVFTPSWLCNAQNNLIDEAWFGHPNPFNTTDEELHTWTSTKSPIRFPEGKTWQDYVAEPRLEITCGEAPYLVSRYDSVSGNIIPISERIGLLDRKMRIVRENCPTVEDWLPAARKALQSIYGYEWQGDSLLLARENIFVSMIEYYKDAFGAESCPPNKEILMWAYIIGWNIFQMDGLKMVVPMSCHDIPNPFNEMFGEPPEPCPGCLHNKKHDHNGIYALIREWPPMGNNGNGKKKRFIDLIK